MPRRKTSILVKLIGITLLAAVVAGWLVPETGGIRAVKFQAAKLISERYPIRLVPADWVKGTDQKTVLDTWISDEITARLSLVGLLWLACISLMIRHHIRAKKIAPEIPILS